MSYYDNSQWPAGGGQAGWEQQTPPARSGASSAIPREESAAFVYQLEEVDRAVDNLVKSGKMFGMSGGRHGRMGAGAGGSRPHSVADYSDSRGGGGPGGGGGGGGGGPGGGGAPHQQQNSSSNLQNFYATQRHQSSRGSNEAEQMMQAKRRMAAQRERELRNYHQEQQYNRTVVAEFSGGYASKPDRSLSPGSMSEDERRELIARQRSALYGEGPFAESGSFSDESGPRSSLSGPQGGGPPGLRGHSPLAYEYGRSPPAHADAASQPPTEGATGSQSAGPNQRSRANSNASPQSNAPSNKGVFDAAAQQSSRTSASSPGGSPPRAGGAPGSKSGQGNTVAPIGTRPSGTSAAPANPALTKRSTTPLPSPLSQGYSAAPGSGEDGAAAASGSSRAPSNPSSATTEGPGGVGLSGWGSRSGTWGNKSGLGVQASVWG